MLARLVLLLLTLVPLVEILLLVWLASQTSALAVVGLVIGAGLLGVWLVRRQSAHTLHRISTDLNAGRMPAESLIDGLVVLAAAVLLIIPGVLSDVLAIALLFPPSRRWIKQYVRNRFKAQVWAARHAVAGSLFDRDQIIDVRVMEVPPGRLSM